jgi:uncharacterized protein YndB with AHSA1/START domain
MHAAAPREAVFAVLTDARRYPDWVVGAREIRAVDPTWPAPGSRFHHRVGLGPLTVDDSTKVEEIDPPRRLVLQARARPHGVARVTFDLVAADDGGTQIVLGEQPVSGVAARLDGRFLEALIVLRNLESLRRLVRLATDGAPP